MSPSVDHSLLPAGTNTSCTTISFPVYFSFSGFFSSFPSFFFSGLRTRRLAFLDACRTLANPRQAARHRFQGSELGGWRFWTLVARLLIRSRAVPSSYWVLLSGAGRCTRNFSCASRSVVQQGQLEVGQAEALLRVFDAIPVGEHPCYVQFFRQGGRLRLSVLGHVDAEPVRHVSEGEVAPRERVRVSQCVLRRCAVGGGERVGIRHGCHGARVGVFCGDGTGSPAISPPGHDTYSRQVRLRGYLGGRAADCPHPSFCATRSDPSFATPFDSWSVAPVDRLS